MILFPILFSVKQHRDVQETPTLQLKMKNYFIASQDKDLRMRVGSVPGIPIIYLNKVTLVLEPPSQDSRDFSKKVRIKIITINFSFLFFSGLLHCFYCP